MKTAVWAAAASWLWGASVAHALDPHRSLTQYSRTVWTQEQGLPQDTIRAIAQTRDGYLWLGTDEGLCRFDGYEFVTFDKANGDLPANSITALAPAADGSLWIGTANGLSHYQNKRFQNYTTKNGLPDDSITQVYVDHAGTVWIVAGVSLSHFESGRFTNLHPDRDIPVTSVRYVREDRHGQIWAGGFTGVAKRVDGKFVTVMDAAALHGNFATTMMLFDRNDNLWIGGGQGLIERSPEGKVRRFGVAEGLPDQVVRTVLEDHDGNIWVGTNEGVARLEGGFFASFPDEADRGRELVRAMFEDREGNLWIGSNSGLERFRDDVFTTYGKTEGLPSDEPNVVFQDRQGNIWVGFHDAGLLMISRDGNRLYTTRDGLPNNEIFSIHEAPNGDLLLGARGGMVRMHDGHFSTYVVPDPLARLNVFDVLEDSSGTIWLATPGGLVERRGRRERILIPGGPLLLAAMVVVSEGPDGAIWAGSYGRGLWRVKDGATRQFTIADGLSSDQIRDIHPDPDGTLWIGTFGGGLDAIRGGKILRFRAEDGLLSDNIAAISDDGESLWLSTTRGICRIAKRQLREFSEGTRRRLEPVNYGVEDGLRSAQCSPSYPTGGGGTRTADGRVWFTTGRGLAVFDPNARKRPLLPAAVQMMEMTAGGRPVDLSKPARLAPEDERIQIRYTGIHLSAPEQVRYWYRLDGLDTDWVWAGNRRTINYNSLKHGVAYRFRVRAALPDGPPTELSYAFELLPRFYETLWFRLFCGVALAASAWAVYKLRLRQIRGRFALVLEERARLAREIHDTLAQGFVGISSQLDAVAMCMPDERAPARRYLDLARRMARHSLTEARRSVMDLRASMLEGQDLAAALESGTRVWTAGSGVEVDVAITGPHDALPEEFEQHLLRIAQEAVTNVLKHAGASRIWVKLHTEARKIYLRILDDGRGFEHHDAFSSGGGHFGLIGMRERAERLGGELRLASHPGEGTEVEVTVPLP